MLLKDEKVSKYPNSIDTRVALLEASIGHINETLNRMDRKFDKIDERFDRIDKKFDKIDEKFDKMNEKIDAKFNLLLTFYISGFAGMFAIMAHGFHWF